MVIVFRRDDRAAEGARLEVVCTRKGTEGSNPSLSGSAKHSREMEGFDNGTTGTPNPSLSGLQVHTKKRYLNGRVLWLNMYYTKRKIKKLRKRP